MPARLRPTATVAADAILVGDPGRALLLAQELLEQPKMSNHARGLWGYWGRTPAGAELTIQSTGMGGPSAAIVLADLAELGVRRAVRVGTGAGLGADRRPGELLLVEDAVAAAGSAASFGLEAGAVVAPNPNLLRRLRDRLPEATAARVASFDALHAEGVPAPSGVAAADMQTATLFAHGPGLGVAVAAVLVVTGTEAGDFADPDDLERGAKRAGTAAVGSLSPSGRGLG